MIRKTLTIILGIFPILAFSQVQQGYVRTIERPDAVSKPLQGVTLRAQGAHGSVITDDSGNFSLALPGLVSGDAYSLQRVHKNGYELVDPGVIGRRYAYSDIASLHVTMVSTAQLQADKMRIEEMAYNEAEKNYKKRLAELEHAMQTNEMTITEYRNGIEELYTSFEKYQSLISSLSDHYARVDYSNLTEIEREINQCIENGKLERADSLLQLIFDPDKLIAELDARIALAEKMLEEADADMAAVLKQQEKDAEYLYHLYTISLARFDNEKARFFIETRAALDSTNVEWQIDAGKFLSNYLADYEKAKSYYKRALETAVEIYGDNHYNVANCYNNIAHVIHIQGNHAEALEFFEKALTIVLMNFEEINPCTSVCYNNIASVYESMDNDRLALEYYSKALEIDIVVFGDEHPAVAASYNNIGGIYVNMKLMSTALEYYNKALAIFLKTFGEKHPDVATCYNNIGTVFSNQGYEEYAIEYYKKGLKIDVEILGEEHPSVGITYANLGNIYHIQGNYPVALEYYNKALAIYLKTFGERHPDVARIYSYIANLYMDDGDDRSALECLEKIYDIMSGFVQCDDPFLMNLQKAIELIRYRIDMD